MLAGGTLVLMGGGLDSSCVALLSATRSAPSNIVGVHFDYGQPAANMERRAATAVSQHFGLVLRTEPIDVRFLCYGYEYKGRHAIFLLVAAALAIEEGCSRIALGIHKGSQYYDASSAFIADMQRILDGYFGTSLVVSTPLIDITKSEIWQVAKSIGLPVELTYSCLSGAEKPCGDCPSCIEREELYASHDLVPRAFDQSR